MSTPADGGDQPAQHYFDFEQFLLELSTQFINVPVASIDEVIETTMGKVCESLGLDLSVLWQWSDRDANLMTITHLHTIPGEHLGGPRPVSSDINQEASGL